MIALDQIHKVTQAIENVFHMSTFVIGPYLLNQLSYFLHSMTQDIVWVYLSRPTIKYGYIYFAICTCFRSRVNYSYTLLLMVCDINDFYNYV